MARSPRASVHRVHGAPAMRALGSATRQEILDVLSGAGPCTVAELATLLGRRPDSLYFHLRALERVGLVVPSAIRTRARHPVATYRLPADRVMLDYDSAPRREVARVVRLAVRLSQREFQRECLSGRPTGQGPARRLWGGRIMGWVSDSEMARVNALLLRAHDLLRRGRPGPTRRAMSLGFLLAPAIFGERVRSRNTRTRKETP